MMDLQVAMEESSTVPVSQTSVPHTTMTSSLSAQPLTEIPMYEVDKSNPLGSSTFEPRVFLPNRHHIKAGYKANLYVKKEKGVAQPPSSTFIPPESPNMLSPNDHFKSLGASLAEFKPSLPSSTYEGVEIGPGQCSSLSLIGSPEVTSNNMNSSMSDLLEGSKGEDLDIAFTPSSKCCKSSFEASVSSTPSKIRSSSRTSFSSGVGHQYLSPDKTHLYQVAPQTKTFNQLVHERGVRDWNPRKLDDRWHLASEEVRKMSGRGKPALSEVSQNFQHDDSFVDSKDRKSRQVERQTAQEACLLYDSRARNSRPFENSAYYDDHYYGLKATEAQLHATENADVVPTPCEVERLDKLVNDLQTGRISISRPFCDREIKQYFYDIVFGNRYGPEPLGVKESLKSALHGHQAKRLGDLRREVLENIDDLVAFVISPAGQCLHEGYSTLRPTINTLARIGSPSTPFAKWFIQDSEAQSQRLIECNPPAFRYEDEAHYRKIQAQCSSPKGSTYSSSQQLPFMRSAVPHQLQRGAQTPTPSFDNIVQAQQLLQYHQMQHMPTKFLPAYYGPTAITNPAYGPNSIHIPNDRFVRPPATSRLAPLFAQSGAWQANNVNTATPKSELQNHFNTPVPRARDTRRLTYVEGSDDMYPQSSLGKGGSVRFQILSRSSPPNYNLVTDDENIPFAESARAARPAEWGVMKLGNIPYDLSKASVIAFLGTHAKIITPDLGPSIHIIMDRATGKTQDCYVEFYSRADAQAWEKYLKNRGNGINRIGDRLIDISLSSQDELLKELFPRAKNIMWEGGHPVVLPPEDQYNTGFKTFLSIEELQILVRHAEQPQRSNYTMKCQNRPYEAMISLLSKFPWQATDLYTLQTRNRIFDAAMKMLGILAREVRRNGVGGANSGALLPGPIPYAGPSVASAHGFGPIPLRNVPSYHNTGKALNEHLLNEYLSAALNAIGFSERQRWELYSVIKDFDEVKTFLISPLAQYWPFEVVGRKAHREEDVVEWYATLLANHPGVKALNTSTTSSTLPFGNLAQVFSNTDETETMDSCGAREWNVLANLLAEMCAR